MSTVIGNGQCLVVGKCRNNKCIFRLIHCFGYNSWDPEDKTLNNAVLEKAGVEKVLFPWINASVGTNDILLTCKDLIE